MDKEHIQERLKEIEEKMGEASFWEDKEKAQILISEMNELKGSLEGIGEYDKGDAIMTMVAGAGGDDAEDFARILLSMYDKYGENKGWRRSLIHENRNDHGGYRNLSVQFHGKGVYGALKHENGIHRLVRISPFNANKKRHTSFVLVQIMPVLKDIPEITLSPDDIEIEFSKSSGPGGQNVNKRETAVRIIHKESGISAKADGERTQEANREQAMTLLKGKLYAALQKAKEKDTESFKLSADINIEWGNQIRSYVLHPYKMVKDHRTGVQVRDIDKILEDGEIQEFIDAFRENSQGE
jgi:peptide chain release factor 2